MPDHTTEDDPVARLRAALAPFPVEEATCWTSALRITLDDGEFPVAALVALADALPGAALVIGYDYSGPCGAGYNQCGGGESALVIVATWPGMAPEWVSEADLDRTGDQP